MKEPEIDTRDLRTVAQVELDLLNAKAKRLGMTDSLPPEPAAANDELTEQQIRLCAEYGCSEADFLALRRRARK
jgi:hypothetical protein